MIQTVRAVLSSISATVIDYVVLMALVELLRVSPVLAGSYSLTAGMLTTYVFSRLWVFPATPQGYRRLEFVAFVAICMLGIAMHSWLMHTFLLLIDTHYLVAKTVTLAMVFGVNFSLRKAVHQWILDQQAVASKY